MVTAQQWIDTGLVPTSGLAAWHMLETGVSGHNTIYDYSGNNNFLSSSPTNSAVLTAGVGPNNSAAWYFNGTNTVPLNVTVPLTVKHVFILASAEPTTFSAYRGLLTGIATGDVFVSNNASTKFFDLGFSAPDFEYRKSGTFYANNDQQAPMGGKFELIEGRAPAGIIMDGLQVGLQKGIAGTIWKGYFSEQLIYTSELSDADIARVHLYFNIKFHTFKTANGGLPLYFPCAHIVPNAQLSGGTMVNSRFRDIPQDYDEITDRWQYEDAGEDFNEVADDTPRRWEYGYQNVSKQQKVIFDQFNAAARKAYSFNFHDNDGMTWNNVRIERYDRDHDGHKRWMQSVNFQLKGSPTSEGTAETI